MVLSNGCDGTMLIYGSPRWLIEVNRKDTVMHLNALNNKLQCYALCPQVKEFI